MGTGQTMVLPVGGNYTVMLSATYFSLQDYATALYLDGAWVKTVYGANSDTGGADQNTIQTVISSVGGGTHTWALSRGSEWQFNWVAVRN